MTINPIGGAILKDSTLRSSGYQQEDGFSQQQMEEKFGSIMLNGEDHCVSFGSLGLDTTDGSFSRNAVFAGELRPFDVQDPSQKKDPLEKRLEESVNGIFQKRKLMASRKTVEDYGVGEGDSFSIQCWGDKQCSLPATCLSTFVCRWLCCCCSRCVSEITPYEQLDKRLIRKECTTSYEECVETFSVYSPEWLVKLFLQMQNARWNKDTRFSREDLLELKQEYFNDPDVPWIGIDPVMSAVNNMRMLTETHSVLKDPLRQKPPWTTWKLLQTTRNSVELVSTCLFLGTELSLELVAEILLTAPTGQKNFSAPGAMKRIYNLLCSNLAVYSHPTPGSDLDPEMVLGLLLRIMETLGVEYTPSPLLQALAFDCDVFKNVQDLSFESQTRTLGCVRRALRSRHKFWYDLFNSQKKEEEKMIPLEEDASGCGGCCTGCSSCCRKSSVASKDVTDGMEMTSPVTTQPLPVGSLKRSTLPGSKATTPILGRRHHHYKGIGYGLMHTAGPRVASTEDSENDSDPEQSLLLKSRFEV